MTTTEILTDENGNYSIDVKPGVYVITASKDCYVNDTVVVIVTDSNVIQNFIIDCIECEVYEPCICPPDKLDWWLLIVGLGIGYVLTREKDDKNKK